MEKLEKWIICENCGFRYLEADLERVCSNCFACVSCRIYLCWNCKAEIVVIPMKRDRCHAEKKPKKSI